MSLIKETETYLTSIVKQLGYDEDVKLVKSQKKELGQFQINCAMPLAKKNGENPVEIANKIVGLFDARFTNVNIAGPGFINVSFTDNYILDYMKKVEQDFTYHVDKSEKKKIVIDYGGANVAKSLHIGHIRSANIGEALKRLASLFGNDVIGDVHLGDIGRQSGMVISEMLEENPDLDMSSKVEITSEQLNRWYPNASKKAKDDENRMELVREISAKIDRGEEPYLSLWKQVVEVSLKDIKKIYSLLNCTFDTYEGEISALPYVEETTKILKPYLYESEGALVIDVKKPDDKIEYPPLIYIKNDGSTIYATRDLATIYARVLKYNPDEIWYVVDERQSLHFEQIFRASYKANLVRNDVLLAHYGFGTVNGKDNKPYKTRDGQVMKLESLLEIVKEEIAKKLDSSIDNYDDTLSKLTIATIKYADLLPYRKTDYIFDTEKFCSLDGKTGSYILYTVVRLKSLIKKCEDKKYEFKQIFTDEQKDFCVKLIELSTILKNSYEERTLNYISEYVFELCNIYNKFYAMNNILNEEDEEKKESFISFSIMVHDQIKQILEILAIEVVDKM